MDKQAKTLLGFRNTDVWNWIEGEIFLEIMRSGGRKSRLKKMKKFDFFLFLLGDLLFPAMGKAIFQT